MSRVITSGSHEIPTEKVRIRICAEAKEQPILIFQQASLVRAQSDKLRDEQRKYILCGGDLAMGKRSKYANSRAVKVDEMYCRDGGYYLSFLAMGMQVVYGEHNPIFLLTAIDKPTDQFIGGVPVSGTV